MPRPLPILFDDTQIVAVDKPADLATIPGRAETDSALQRLSAQLGQPLRVVHRLDKQTSGLLLFARSIEAQRHLSHQFQNNAVEKQYLALVRGRPTTDEGEINAPLARHPASPKRMAVVRHGGRPARTLWRIEQRFGELTLLRVFPKTGKTHQIRVHLQSIGLPLAIDPLYNPAPEQAIFLSSFKRGYRPGREPERPLMSRLTLHAERLRFLDLNAIPIELLAPLPKDFRVLLQAVAKFGKGH
jgi:RluA family pseudouridine synthase